jgi:hypothetical protein
MKLILDNHSHISKETRAWLAAQPAHRLEFTFTPSRAPGSISSTVPFQTRPPATHPRRIQAGTQAPPWSFFNGGSVVHMTHKLDHGRRYDSNFEIARLD